MGGTGNDASLQYHQDDVARGKKKNKMFMYLVLWHVVIETRNMNKELIGRCVLTLHHHY